MKFVIAVTILLTFFVSMITAQRGSYAGSAPIVGGYKQGWGGESNTGNRIDDNLQSTQSAQPSIPFIAPAQNNYNLINRIAQLPSQHQPFWYLNSQAINNHLNQQQSFVPGTFVGGRR